MGHLNGDRHAIDQHDLVAPIELVRLARLESQRHEGCRGCLALTPTPFSGIAPDGIVAPVVAEHPQFLE